MKLDRSNFANAIALLLFFSVSSTNLLGQDKGFISLGLGPSFTLGDYASVDATNDNAGFASGGLLFDLSFGYKLSDRLGLAGLVRSQANPVDAEALARAFVVPGYSLTVQADAYGLGCFFIGGYGSFGINEQLSFETRAMIGYAVTQAPSVNYSYFNLSNSQTIRFEQGVASAGAFAYDLGVGLRRNLGKRLGLSTMLDLIGTNPEFEYQVLNFDGTTSFSVVSQPVMALNLTINLAYRFGVNQ
jgi:hypothetical protein